MNLLHKYIVVGCIVAATTCVEARPKNELRCLAEAIHQESRGEHYYGKLAVAQVVLNRQRSPAWPGTLCGVVFQKAQFSWTKRWKTWTYSPQSMSVAKLATLYAPHSMDHLKATHFYSGAYPKSWPPLSYEITVGKHHFYK